MESVAFVCVCGQIMPDAGAERCRVALDSRKLNEKYKIVVAALTEGNSIVFYYSAPSPGKVLQSIVISVSVCLSVCLLFCLSTHPYFTKFSVHVTCGGGLIIF